MKTCKRKDAFSRYYESVYAQDSNLVCPTCGEYIYYGFKLRERIAFNEKIQEWCHEWCLENEKER